MKKYTHVTKKCIEDALLKFNGDKKAIVEYLGVTPSWLRDHMILWEISMIDCRSISNKNRKIQPAPKEELEELYTVQNLTLLEISKKYNASNVTVKKWFIDYKIPLLTHSQTIKNKVTPKIQKHNMETYGNKDFFATEEGKQKVKDGLTKKYGVPFYPIKNTSRGELEMLDFVNTLSNTFSKKHFNGIEIDIYSDDLKIGIEYCGLYWHSEKVKGADLHVKKYKICKENNIRLFTVFEDEWNNRKEQVKGFIKSALGLNEIKIHARKCLIKNYHPRDMSVNKFLEDNHIQSKTNIANVVAHYGLVFNDEIVSIMTISKHHRNSTEYVLSRYCVKSNVTIMGGASKLFSIVKENFKGNTLKTWSDNRWSEGNMYPVLGFKLKTEYPRDYSYTIGGHRISKQSMTRKKIGASSDQTEYERALELGYDRVWDCGKKLWVIDL